MSYASTILRYNLNNSHGSLTVLAKEPKATPLICVNQVTCCTIKNNLPIYLYLIIYNGYDRFQPIKKLFKFNFRKASG